MSKFIVILIFSLAFAFNLNAQHYIDSTQNYLKHASNISIQPGDTVYLLAGKRDYLMLEDFAGDSLNPVIITNYGGEVEVNTNHYFGINIINCKHIKISGKGDSTIKYGINISKVSNGAGISFNKLSTDFELEYTKIQNTKLAGIYAKSDPDTTFTSVRDSFLMKNVKIHHNSFYNIGDEGMYIGSSKFFGQNINYQGSDTLLMPHLIKNIEIYQNYIVKTGWDGIQLSSASLGENSVYDNVIFKDSYKGHNIQKSGIIMGGGTKADCYNNYISDGKGTGILVMSLGGQKIYNNVIIRAGIDYYPNDPNKREHGIFVGDVSCQNDSSFYIFNNTIVNPKSDCIRFNSKVSRNNKIFNNVLLKPLAYHYYDSISSSFTAEDAFIMVSFSDSEVDTFNNESSMTYAQFHFNDTLNDDFTLTTNSPLIDAAYNLTNYNINFDHYNNLRPIGTGYDIGAFEFDSTKVNIKTTVSNNKIKVYPNPADTVIIIDNLGMFKAKSYELYNINGKMIKKYSLNKGLKKIKINTKNLKAGIYILVINGSNKSLSKKIIIN